MKNPEGYVREPVRKWLAALPHCYRFSPVQMGLGATTVDDLVCINGRFVGIEYKAPDKQPTPRQLLTLRQIHAAGGVAIWGDDADKIIEELKTALGLP